MDQHQFHSLVGEMVNYSLQVQPAQRRRAVNRHDKAKRNATYFPSKVSFNTKWNFAAAAAADDWDDESTWEFSAPVAPSSCSSSCYTSGTGSSTSTPAQEIVIRYRAGLPLACLEGRFSFGDSSDDSSWELEITPFDNTSTPSDHASAVVEKDLKATYRQSQLEALEHTREEAIAVMKKYGLGEHDSLVCHRPDCRDTLRDVKAFMFHLHIHDIHDQNPQCPTCGKRHETHRCSNLKRQSHFKSPPASPIKESFFRIMGKISRKT